MQVMRYFCPRLINEDGKYQSNMILKVSGKKIIGLSREYPTSTDDKYDVVFPSDSIVLPGFIDCHVHLALDGIDFNQSLGRWQDDSLWVPKVKQQLKDTLKCGIVAVRDGSDKAAIGLKAKKLMVAKPVIISCGKAIYQKGRYGTFLGHGITNINKLKQVINDLAAAGINQVKVVASGIVSFNQYGKVGGPQFDLDFFKEIVNEAHRKGLRVMTHASGAEAVETAVEAGVDSIEHGFFVKKDTLRKMSQRGIVWVPTVIAAGGRLNFNRPAENRDVIEKTVNEHLERISWAKDAGVTIAVGTDAGAPGVPHGKSFVKELRYLSQAGLTNEELIKAASETGAAVLEINQLGSLAEGKSASFIVTRDNNGGIVGMAENISDVYHQGRRIS